MPTTTDRTRRTDRDALVTAHLHLIDHVVRTVTARFPRHIDADDLWDAGALGLLDAADRYDASVGVPFARYAAVRIRGAVIDATRQRDWTGRGVRRRAREATEVAGRFAQEHGREPTADELAERLGVSRARLESLRTAVDRATMVQLDAPQGHDADSGAGTLLDLVTDEDPSRQPEQHLERTELLGDLRTALGELPEVLREVLVRHYLDGDQLTDVAADLGVTVARASQLRLEGVNALRAFLARSGHVVPEVTSTAPGGRARTSFVQRMEATTWRQRYAAGQARPGALGASRQPVPLAS